MTDTDKPQDQRDIDAREALQQQRDAWAESATRTCIPENKTGIIWALGNVLREFDHLIGDGPHTDRACDTMRDAISAVMATYDKHAKLARPAPEELGAAGVSERHQMQLAGISTAAFGAWKEGDSVHPDYDTVALRDVAKLYAKYAELSRRIDEAVDVLQRVVDLDADYILTPERLQADRDARAIIAKAKEEQS